MRRKLHTEADPAPYKPAVRALDAFGEQPRVDGHRPLGRLAEVEALAEIDAEVEHRLVLVDALDPLSDDLGALLVGELDHRGDQLAARVGALDALGERVG